MVSIFPTLETLLERILTIQYRVKVCVTENFLVKIQQYGKYSTRINPSVKWSVHWCLWTSRNTIFVHSITRRCTSDCKCPHHYIEISNRSSYPTSMGIIFCLAINRGLVKKTRIRFIPYHHPGEHEIMLNFVHFTWSIRVCSLPWKLNSPFRPHYFPLPNDAIRVQLLLFFKGTVSQHTVFSFRVYKIKPSTFFWTPRCYLIFKFIS